VCNAGSKGGRTISHVESAGKEGSAQGVRMVEESGVPGQEATRPGKKNPKKDNKKKEARTD